MVSQAAELFAFHCRAAGLTPVREFAFADSIGRRWRADFAWPDLRLLVEIEGIVVRRVNGRTQAGGRHATIGGIIGDCEKYNAAAILGYHVLRFTQAMVRGGAAISTVEKFVQSRQEQQSCQSSTHR